MHGLLNIFSKPLTRLRDPAPRPSPGPFTIARATLSERARRRHAVGGPAVTAQISAAETARTLQQRVVLEAELPPTPRADQGDTAAPLAVHLDRTERRVSVTGELDMATVPLLAQVMAMLLDFDRGDSTVDLSGVTFIDASGLGCLVDYAAQLAAAGAKFSVVDATPRVHRVFDMVGLGDLLEAS